MTRPPRLSGTARRGEMSALRWLMVVVATGGLLLALPPTAGAHPLGLPAFAQIAAGDAGEVTIAWNAAPDDVAALARSLGVEVAPGQVLTREQDAALSSSDALQDALLDHVAVVQAGEACEGDVEVTSLVEDGASWRFACPSPVTAVEVTITLLTDLDERYRTLATATTADGAQRVMFTSTAPTHELALTEQGGAATPAAAPPVDSGAPVSDNPGSDFGGSLSLESRFVALIDRPAGAGALLVGLLVALGIGALHGLAPGHGKAIAAAYLVGDRGRPRDAVLLGTVVALMHTWSVLALGYALYLASQRPATEALSAWLRLVSGVLVAVLGGWLLVRRLRERREHHDHNHDHVPADPDHPLSWRGLVTLGAAGGLLPSPSALLVVFTALALGRVGYGLALIVAFSLGLAATVSAVGLAVLRGRDVLAARVDTSPRWRAFATVLPLVAAAAVLVFGAAVAGSAAVDVLAAR